MTIANTHLTMRTCALNESAACASPSKKAKIGALNKCSTRIKEIIRQADLNSKNKMLDKLNCPIDYEFPDDPVVANCGHLFNKTSILQWAEECSTCALCREPLTQLTNVIALRQFVENRYEDDYIPTLNSFSMEDEFKAKKFVKIAKSLIKQEEYGLALKVYSRAIDYTKSSKVYEGIPLLYDQLGEKDKAALSRLHLSLYQLEEGKVEQALHSLKDCTDEPLLMGLCLQASPTIENLARAMISALNQDKLEDKIFIYKQVLATFPGKLSAYQHLIPLIKNPREKTTLLLKAAHLAHASGQPDLEKSYRRAAQQLKKRPITMHFFKKSIIYSLRHRKLSKKLT